MIRIPLNQPAEVETFACGLKVSVAQQQLSQSDTIDGSEIRLTTWHGAETL